MDVPSRTSGTARERISFPEALEGNSTIVTSPLKNISILQYFDELSNHEFSNRKLNNRASMNSATTSGTALERILFPEVLEGNGITVTSPFKNLRHRSRTHFVPWGTRRERHNSDLTTREHFAKLNNRLRHHSRTHFVPWGTRREQHNSDFTTRERILFPEALEGNGIIVTLPLESSRHRSKNFCTTDAQIFRIF